MGYSHGMNPGYSDDKIAVLKRLKRIEGQVRGIERMVETQECREHSEGYL